MGIGSRCPAAGRPAQSEGCLASAGTDTDRKTIVEQFSSDRAIRGVTDLPPLGTVLAVWAHPDDESFVAGGLLAAASDAGSTIVCLTATRGEQGTADHGRWDEVRLARTRSHELAAARAVLGVEGHMWLPFRDGACETVSPGRGLAAVARAIDEVQPDTIVTFGPDGITGHADHRAVSQWTSHAWAAVRPSATLLWAALTADAAAQMAEAEPAAGAFYPGYPRTTPDADVVLRLDLRGELLDRKFAAIRAHATQSAELVHRLGEDAFRRWWSTESFVQVGRGGATSAIAPVTHRPHLVRFGGTRPWRDDRELAAS